MATTVAAAPEDSAISVMDAEALPMDQDSFRGKPISDRSQTKRAMQALIEGATTGTNDTVFGQGPFLVSDIPEGVRYGRCGVSVGIDEAGRGSVLGPMIYGAAFWANPETEKDEKNVFADSKQLSEERRSYLWKNHILADASLGFCVRVLTAAEISRNMWRCPEPYNLNQMSHDAAIQMIQQLLDSGVNVEHCYIDTVGNPVHYQRKLEQIFSKYSISFTVEPKADGKYPTCQAASVVAKVTRDAIVEHLTKQSEKSLGSGYPSDPTCQAWIQHQLEHHGCPVFGFSPTAAPLVRFSWNPIKLALVEKKTGGTRSVTFAADEKGDEDDAETRLQAKRQRMSMQAFLGQSNKKQRRYPYMEQKGIQIVTEL